MKIKLTPVIIVLMLLILGSCKNWSNTTSLKNSTGNAGELVVVINPEIWESESGKFMKDILTQTQIGLPQDEPVFDVIHIPQEAFGDIFKTTRNLVLTKISSSVTVPEVTYQRNVYANMQNVVSISAKDQTQFLELLQKNADKMVGFFLKAERERIIYNYTNFNEKAVSLKTDEFFGFALSIPPGYKVIEESDSFMWIRYEVPEVSQGIFVYSFPYESDSTFTLKYMLAKKNIILKNEVPGPTQGSYMTTETEYPILFNTLKNNGNYASEMRGLWKLENDFMGGPFVSLAILDLLKKRVVVLDGYVYAPNKNKRNYLRQVEGIIYSAKFNNQSEMDKMNRQFE